MLELLYHKLNSHIATVVDGSIFKKILRLSLEEKTEEDIIFAWVFQ